MSNTSTLQVVVNPNGAVTGAGQVTSAINNMVNNSNAALQRMGGSFQRLQGFIDKARQSVSGFFSTLINTAAIEHLLDRLIEVNVQYTQFTSTLLAVKGSANLAAEEFNYLFDVSNQLGQNVEAMSKNYMRLAASMGHVDSTGKSTRQVFEGIATAASVLHLKGYEANGILIAFEQILSKNKVSLEEVQRQLSNRMPDAMGTAARAMNMTQSEFRKAITEGSINPLEFVLKMANQIKIQYGEAAKITADSFVGQQNRMFNAVAQLYRQVGQNGAMEGLVNILKAVTSVLDNPDIGVALGRSLGDLFNKIADWISTVTASDISDFFDGLSGVVQSFVITLRDLGKEFATTADGQVDMIEFSRNVAKGFLVVIEVIRTFIALLMTIPRGLAVASAAYEVFGRVTSPKAIGFGQSDKEHADYVKGTEAAQKRLEDAKKQFSKTADVALFHGTMDETRKNINGVFDAFEKARESRGKSQSFPVSKKTYDTGPLSNEEIAKLAKENPDPAKKTKNGRDVFNQESVTLAKAAATSMLEYNNVMNDTLGIENKYITQLEIKFRYDKDYIKLSSSKKDALRELAHQADEAAMKEKAAQAFQADRMALNKGLYETELALVDVAEYRNAADSKNTREFEEKLKFDAAYHSMSSDMIKIERDKAKALDELTIKLQNVRKEEASRYQTHILELKVARDAASMQKGLGVSKYNEADNYKDSIRVGGTNFNDDAKTKLNNLQDARARDTANRQNDFNALSYSYMQQASQWDFEASMIGKSAIEIQKFTDLRKIHLAVQEMSIGATDEERQKLDDLASTLGARVVTMYDTLDARQKDWLNGFKSGIAQYYDEISNVSKTLERSTTKIFKGMEDTLVNFIMTGKFDFKDFANMVIEELVRMMVQMLIMKPIIEFMKTSMGGEGGGGGFFATMGSMLFSAKGNVFDHGQHIQKFASGAAFSNKIVNTPTNFNMGQMGEKGPEAVMPLTRDSSGRLGVSAQGGGGGGGVGQISINVQVINGQDGPEVKTVTNKDGEELADKIKAVTLGVIHEEMRAGGVLASRK